MITSHDSDVPHVELVLVISELKVILCRQLFTSSVFIGNK